jgi:hypothetical protein
MRDSATGDFDFLMRLDSNLRLPLLAGNVEVSPFTFISGRLAGSTSIIEQRGDFQRLTTLSTESTFNAKPSFNEWEAAGLCHLYQSDGYRFSVTAGYRQESISLVGVGTSGVNLSSRDDSSIYAPFMGLQSAVFFPWWKARCELLGSPWMSKKLSGNVIRTDSTVIYGGSGQGWLLEVQIEGTANLTRFVFLGVHARYTSQESNGDFIRKDNGQLIGRFPMYTNDSLAIVGLDVTLVF